MAWTVITDKEGRRVKAELLAENPDGQQLRLEDGRMLVVPHDVLVRERGGDLLLLWSWDELESGAASSEVLPLVAETLRVDKRRVERGRVQVQKTVVEHQETVDEPLAYDELQVERVSVGRMVEAPEPVRYEGDLTIIPLFEEVLVVEKRLMLTEEVRVSRTRLERRESQQVTLRREEAVVERLAGDDLNHPNFQSDDFQNDKG